MPHTVHTSRPVSARPGMIRGVLLDAITLCLIVLITAVSLIILHSALASPVLSV